MPSKAPGRVLAAGKANVSVNALKHGLTARDILLPNESREEYEQFRKRLRLDLGPKSALEEALAEKIIDDLWRLRRVPFLEANVYWRAYREVLVRQAISNTVRAHPPWREEHLSSAQKEAEQRFTEARSASEDPSLQITSALETRPQALTNLWRHEAALVKSVLKNLDELQRFQAARAGAPVLPPAVVDVNLDLGSSGIQDDDD